MYKKEKRKNIYIKIKSKVKKREKEKKRQWERERERERGGKEFFFSLLLSKIYGNLTVGFRWSKRQSLSTYRELRVGTKIFEFHYEIGNFPTYVISSLKAI